MQCMYRCVYMHAQWCGAMDPTSRTASARLERLCRSCLKVADKRSWHRVWGVLCVLLQLHIVEMLR
jgi:hypothetical protein